MLSNVYISDFIKKRSQQVFEEKQMTIAEALALSAAIARGEVQKGSSKQFDRLANEVVKDIEFEYTPSIEERQKSIEHILKVNGAFDKKTDDKDSVDGDITIEIDYGDDDVEITDE